jgi:hypothetical protein
VCNFVSVVFLLSDVSFRCSLFCDFTQHNAMSFTSWQKPDTTDVSVIMRREMK